MESTSNDRSTGAPEISIRPARPGDDQALARLLYSSWPGRFGFLAGGDRDAVDLVLAAVARRRNVASRDVVLVAEIDQTVACAVAAFPASERHPRHRRLLLLALRRRPLRDWPSVIRHYRMSLRRPKDLPARTLYVDALAASAQFHRPDVASLLLRAAARDAKSTGMDGIAVHTHKANTRTRAFYEGAGFNVFDEAPQLELLLLYRTLSGAV